MSTMSSDPDTRLTTTEVRGRAVDTFVERYARETKPSFMTSEFWLTLAGVAALIIAYNVVDNSTLDLWRTCLLATMLGMSYVISRGFAKSGSRDPYGRPDY
jgi:hypothetical protein